MKVPVSSKWRLLEINAGLPSRFLCIQVEGEIPRYYSNWKLLEKTATEQKLDTFPVDSVGDRCGEWIEGDPPLYLHNCQSSVELVIHIGHRRV